MNLKTLFGLKKILENKKLYTEALNVNYLIKCAATNPIATNITQQTELSSGFFSPEDVDPENYKNKLSKLYYNDIRNAHYNRLVTKLLKEEASEEKAKALADKKIEELVEKQVRKTMEGHKEFVSKLKEMNLSSGGTVVSPGSGFSHEQVIAPDLKWMGLEYQKNLVDMANQRNEQMGIAPKTKRWSLTKVDPGEKLGEDWNQKINEIVDENGNIEALYAKHACGGLTDGAMYKAVSSMVPKIFLATCCANRYTELSWRILEPKNEDGTPMSEADYEKIAKKSKSQDLSGKEFVEKIDGWREDFLKRNGYEVERGMGSHGPYIKAILKS
jgi:hypothetical protein